MVELYKHNVKEISIFIEVSLELAKKCGSNKEIVNQYALNSM